MKSELGRGVVAVVIAIIAMGAAFGAKNPRPEISAGSASGMSFDSSGGTKVASITDPILNMKAYSITIPANWVFAGAVIRGTSCIDGAVSRFPNVDAGRTGGYQAIAADGLDLVR